MVRVELGIDAEMESGAMNIRIERRTWQEGYARSATLNKKRGSICTIYLVIVNGRRVDSFLRKRNAQEKVRAIRASSS